MSTKAELLQALHLAAPRFIFAMREPYDSRWVGAVSLWARIKQLFTGPVSVSRQGEIEVAVICRGGWPTQQETDAYCNAAKDVVAAGVKVSFVEFER